MLKPKSNQVRVFTITATVVMVMLGSVRMLNVGTLSAFGIRSISAVCPLGYLEVALASRSLIPRLWIPLLIILLLTIVFGRVFCGWICPAPLLGFRSSKKNGRTSSDSVSDRKLAILNKSDQPISSNAAPPTLEAKRDWYNRLAVLGAVLASSAFFGFPVFCLICPIGLTFGSLFALMRLFRFNEPTITLLVFPGVLILELVILRKWCGRFCPLGALLSLVSHLNVFFRPRVDQNVCLTANGSTCGICEKVCPEGIRLQVPEAPIGECTKCRDCAENCPVQAITFPRWGKSK